MINRIVRAVAKPIKCVAGGVRESELVVVYGLCGCKPASVLFYKMVSPGRYPA